MSVECVCCDIGCLAANFVFFIFEFDVRFFYGGMFGRCLCFLFQRYAIVLAACVLSLIVLSEFDFDLCLYLGLPACWDVRCYG